MDFAEIRRLIIVAVFSDDELFDHLVLKGGNALELVHRVIDRGSMDIDLSMPGDFEDLADTEGRIFRALRGRFDSAGYTVFDEKFGPRPRDLGPNKPPTWGGYLVEFKLIPREQAVKMGYAIERMRREAHVLGPSSKKIFRIEISKYEFCIGKAEADVDGYTVYVYTPEMCVFEKLRAICQQMPEYKPTTGTKRTRARDFYDIHATVDALDIDLSSPENLELCRNIFAAKDVSLSLISAIPESREAHRSGWDAVVASVVGDVRDFDYYFDYVARVVVRKLKPLWIE